METKQKVIESLVESLEVSPSTYELAESRYKDLGVWLHDASKAKVAPYDPHVFPQGSIRLGTAIRPLDSDHYDLDLACELRAGISTNSHSQEDVKAFIGGDLEKYRIERNIKDKLDEKHRCWRLNYQDSPRFHMDTVPCIPHDEKIRQHLFESMKTGSIQTELADNIANQAIAITDNRRPDFSMLSPNWPISNPEGYAIWFESRMRQAKQLLECRVASALVASIEELPTYQWKSPLQRCVQILKRHRDQMFRQNGDAKPISIIITTLAAQAYQGERDIYEVLAQILNSMGNFVRPTAPRVPNPVNPKEDFADKWGTLEGKRLALEDNFRLWLQQAKADFENLSSARTRQRVASLTTHKYGVNISEERLEQIPGLSSSAPTIASFKIAESSPPKPWQK